jgi:hypothetical protein
MMNDYMNAFTLYILTPKRYMTSNSDSLGFNFIFTFFTFTASATTTSRHWQ